MTVYITLALSIILSTLSQISQKYAAMHSAQKKRSTLTIPAFWIAMILLVSSMAFWMYVLAHMDISKAYPMLSFNYVIVMIVSRMLFKEPITINRLMGMTLIVCGIIFISLS